MKQKIIIPLIVDVEFNDEKSKRKALAELNNMLIGTSVLGGSYSIKVIKAKNHYEN